MAFDTSNIFNLPMPDTRLGASRVTVPEAPPVPSQVNPAYVEQQRAAAQAAADAKAHRSGLQNVLGALGDFVMTRLHMPADYLYSTHKKEDQLNAAMTGYDVNPDEAIKKVSAVDFTTGERMRERKVVQDSTDAQRAATNSYRDLLADNAHQVALDKKRANLANITQTVMAAKDPAKAWVAAQRLLQRNDPEGELGELPATYDPEWAQLNAGAGIRASTQVRQAETAKQDDIKNGQRDRQLDQGDRRLDQGDTRNDQGQQRVDSYASGVESGADARGRARITGSYVDTDGYRHVTFDDGSEQVSSAKVRPTKQSRPIPTLPGSAPAPSAKTVPGAPAVGYKNKYGMTFQGGDPNNRANWK